MFSFLQTSMAASCHKELQVRQHFGEWIRNDIQYSSVQNYELTYAHFVRFPSWEISPPGSSPGKMISHRSRRRRRNNRKSRRNIRRCSPFLVLRDSAPFLLGKRPLRVIDKVIFSALLSEIWRSKISWNSPDSCRLWVRLRMPSKYHGSITKITNLRSARRNDDKASKTHETTAIARSKQLLP